jgi:hypothetical protein
MGPKAAIHSIPRKEVIERMRKLLHSGLVAEHISSILNRFHEYSL